MKDIIRPRKKLIEIGAVKLQDCLGVAEQFRGSPLRKLLYFNINNYKKAKINLVIWIEKAKRNFHKARM